MRSEFCDEMVTNKMGVRIMSYNVTSSFGRSLCSDLGGWMPLPTRAKDLNATFGRNISALMTPECPATFWLPLHKSKNNSLKWVEGYRAKPEKEVDYLPWAYGQPNGENSR